MQSRPGLALTALVSAYLMVGMDQSIVNIALPAIGDDLGFSATGLSWLVNGYLITSGGLLLAGGRAGDVFGRRRILIAGVALFTVGSAGAGLATSPGLLLAARAVQGIGAALSSPSTLALVATTFTAEPERARALSVYSAAAGGGASLGLVAGGVLTEWASWRSVFYVTVPLGLLVILLARRVLPEPERHPGRLDLSGGALATTGIGALVYSLVRVASHGWTDGGAVLAFALSALLLGTFVIVEARHPSPLLPLGLLADRNRAFAYVNVALIPAAMLGTFYFLTQYFQNVMDLSPVRAGLAFLPLTLPMLAVVRLVPKLLTRVGTRPLMITGSTLILAALLWLSRLGPGSSYPTGVLVPLLVLGSGVGLSFMPLNLTILSGVAPTDSGAASGLIQTLQLAGSSLGLAALTTAYARLDNPDLSARIGAAFTLAAGFAAVALAVVVFGLRSVKRPQLPSPAPDAAGTDRNVAR